MKIFITLLISGIFTNNIITSGLLGIDELHYNRKKGLKALLKDCGIITALLFVSTVITYPVLKYVIIPLKIDYLAPLSCVVLICGVIFAVNILSKRFLPKAYVFLSKNSRMITCSPVVLGLCLLNVSSEIVTGYPTALLYSVLTGIGFAVVSVIFSSVNDRINASDLPKVLKGLPMTLIIVALISLAFGGFAGI